MRILPALLLALVAVAAAILFLKRTPSPARVVRESASASPQEVRTAAAPTRLRKKRTSPPPTPPPLPEDREWESGRPGERAATTSGRMYARSVEGRWTPEESAELRRHFLNSPDDTTWSVALWAVRRHPSSEILSWIEELLASNAPNRQKTLALRILAQRREPEALAMLARHRESSEEACRIAAAESLRDRSRWDPLARSWRAR